MSRRKTLPNIMPRFAILTHDHPTLHWDFLLEQGDSCRTWRLLSSPDSPGDIPAEEIAEHRLMYLDYEGPVSGNRGTVTQWDAGTFEWLEPCDDLCKVRLHGLWFTGLAQLIHSHGSEIAWRFETRDR